MTIPEQAVEAAAKIIVAGVGDCVTINKELFADVLKRRGTLERALTAALPLLGVQRPEDVAREPMKIALTVLCAARSGQSWHGKMLKAFDCAIYGLRVALESAALPLPGQPQEGEDWNRTQRRDGTWASDEPERQDVFEIIVKALKHAKADIDATIPYIGRLEGTPYGLLQTQRLLEEALLALSAAPASPRAEPTFEATLALSSAWQRAEGLCEDCPPVGYPTDDTRCRPCPRRALVADQRPEEK